MKRFIAQKVFLECEAPTVRLMGCDVPLFGSAGKRLEAMGDYGGQI
jgi:hypothetical protein